MDLTRIIQTHFSNIQLIWIGISFIFGLLSMAFFLKRKTTIGVCMLFLSGFILRVIVAGLDLYLNTWDEQYHALVAKNMMANPFKPVLIKNPIFEFDYWDWSSNYIWLHKPPWFLWQISLFFKLFGVSEWVLRMPTVIMFSLLIPVIYRIGLLISTKQIAWYGAFLYTYSFYFVNFVSGGTFTDHNDSAFIFYISLSIWSWLEYKRYGKLKWIIAIGIFTGIAIMNKWLAGLLVYSGWFVSTLVHLKKDHWSGEFKNLGLALLFTILIALPWQVYIFLDYPLESQAVFVFNNSRHFLEALDGHGETRWYHFGLLSTQYGGLLVPFVILPGLYFLLKPLPDKEIRTAVVTFLAITYVFFTLAQTKMPMYCTIVCPLIFLALGAILDKGIETIRQHTPSRISVWVITGVLCTLAYLNLNINQIDEWHSAKLPEWKNKTNLAARFKAVIQENDLSTDVFFNCQGFNAVMFMFYSGKTAYNFYPNESQYRELKKKRIRMTTFEDQFIPGYLKNDSEIKKIPL